jgi:N-acetylglutamate synthase-like GNAT family acetyltransferase
VNLSIRKAKLKDTDSIVRLAEELGYLTTPEEIKSKLRRISADLAEEVYVAAYANVIGWMHIALTEPLESNRFVEIRGIVVKKEFRGKGAGTKLIETAELWAKSNDCTRIRIRTNIVRTDTREYYRKRGFISKKTQEVFEKSII